MRCVEFVQKGAQLQSDRIAAGEPETRTGGFLGSTFSVALVDPLPQLPVQLVHVLRCLLELAANLWINQHLRTVSSFEVPPAPLRKVIEVCADGPQAPCSRRRLPRHR